MVKRLPRWTSGYHQRSRVRLSGRTAVRFLLQEVLKAAGNMEEYGISRLSLRDHIKLSVSVVMNIYGNLYWELNVLKYTDS